MSGFKPFNALISLHSFKKSGFTIAEYNAKIGPVSLHLPLIAQPPWDSKLKDFYMIHYTYGQDFDEKGKFTPGKVGYWHWDKRDFMSKAIPRNIPLPPKGCTNEVRSILHCIAA